MSKVNKFVGMSRAGSTMGNGVSMASRSYASSSPGGTSTIKSAVTQGAWKPGSNAGTSTLSSKQSTSNFTGKSHLHGRPQYKGEWPSSKGSLSFNLASGKSDPMGRGEMRAPKNADNIMTPNIVPKTTSKDPGSKVGGSGRMKK